MPDVFSSNGHTATGAPPSAPRLARLGDLLGEYEADATAAYEARTTGRARGPVTGLTGLDRELGGALAPGVHVVHGGPGVGKTAIALQIAATSGAGTLFITCEMGALELLRRVTARITGTYLGRLKSGELEPADAVRLVRQGAAAAPALALADATRAWASPTWIRDAAESVRDAAGRLLVVLDSVHSWAEGTPAVLAEYDALNAALAELRQLAAALQAPILVVAERNRASMAGGGLHASAGTRKFEYGAESVFDLSADKDATVDAAGELAATLTISKNRNNSPGRKIPLLFHGALQRFREA